MTKTFERFLRSFSDDELQAFAQERGKVRPPYWKVMQLALRIELSRRGLRMEDELSAVVAHVDAEPPTRSATI